MSNLHFVDRVALLIQLLQDEYPDFCVAPDGAIGVDSSVFEELVCGEDNVHIVKPYGSFIVELVIHRGERQW
jgi:hypothetical protein